MLSDEEYGAAVRVYRGGSFRDDARDCRSAYRYRNSPDNRYGNLGLRPVITIGLSYGFTIPGHLTGWDDVGRHRYYRRLADQQT